jgi:glycosyltransferase involved in cell wall biosynthesis
MKLDKSMKICLVTRFFDLRNGGIGRFSMEMLKGLQNRGYDIKQVSTNRQGYIGHVVYTAIELAYGMPKGCDIYHCLSPMEAIYTPKKLSVVTFHDFIPWLHVDPADVHGRVRRLRKRLSRYYFQTTVKIASRGSQIACHSELTRRELIEHLGVDESKVSIIRYGINPNLEPVKKKDDVFRIGTLSYLDQRKRIDLLIRAFLDANVDGELVIGGSGVDHSRLKEMAGEDKRIKFLGFVPEDKMTDFYNSLDVFVFPTKVEGYGLPIIEALACRKPVVVLSDAYMPDEVKMHCTVVDNLKDFLKNPKPLQNIDAGYAFAKTHDWNNCVDQYLGLYRRILGN